MRIAAAFIGLALSVYASPALAGWQQVTEQVHGYSAKFPAAPKTQDSVSSGVLLHTSLAAVNGTSCMVIVVDYGHPLNIDTELAANRDNFVKNAGASLSSQKRISISRGNTALPALTLDAQNAKSNFRALFIIAETKEYGVVATVPKNGGASSDLSRCLQGFRLLEE